ncbi:hypothetical protein [Yoonia vestfoldensis]|uniref:hypothetical protein n=1 Tax=Yoonia vestfoldensis TaxID=245188 RepID=UPI00036D1096|nr:hypothetical protein [Yoonia vestfoldensis]
MTARVFVTALLGLLLATAIPVAARADTVLAICTSGGCQCSLSPLSAQEIAEVVGEPSISETPVDRAVATLVYEPDAGIMSWVDAPRRDIYASFGGDGDCPVEVFAAPDAMVPQDGTWQWRTLAEATSGCPADLGGMLAASQVAFMSRRVEWDGAFHPDRLAEGLPQPDVPGMSSYEWREAGPYRWLSDNVQNRECSDGACTEIALWLTMTLVAPDRISGLLSLRSAIDAPKAAMRAGFGLADCRVRVRFDFMRTGP